MGRAVRCRNHLLVERHGGHRKVDHLTHRRRVVCPRGKPNRFFFKRGERDRGNAAHLFTTIAAQLSTRLPGLAPLLNKAIDEDPSVPHKSIRFQFDALILEPLRKIDAGQSTQTSTCSLVIVIDALDLASPQVICLDQT